MTIGGNARQLKMCHELVHACFSDCNRTVPCQSAYQWQMMILGVIGLERNGESRVRDQQQRRVTFIVIIKHRSPMARVRNGAFSDCALCFQTQPLTTPPTMWSND